MLGSFVVLGRELEEGGELPFAFEQHGGRDGPFLYEYRPLARSFVEERELVLRDRDDARFALEELRREPAAAIFARAHAGPEPSEELALFRTVLLALVVATAEACGGFDWDDAAFERAYAELERSLFGSHRAYAAVAPLVGLSAGAAVDLGDGIRVRAAADDELSRHWPEARGLLPERFGREIDRRCVLELERPLEAGEEPPDAPAELADAVSALRLATAGPVAAGPVLFERLDGRAYGIRPVLPIAATQPPCEPTRLDPFRGGVAHDLLARLEQADADPALAEALDRWELSLFQHDPFRSEQLRAALRALFESTWPLRVAALLEPAGGERAALHVSLRSLAEGAHADAAAADAVRRALVETLRRGDRAALAGELDTELLGISRAAPLRRAG